MKARNKLELLLSIMGLRMVVWSNFLWGVQMDEFYWEFWSHVCTRLSIDQRLFLDQSYDISIWSDEMIGWSGYKIHDGIFPSLNHSFSNPKVILIGNRNFKCQRNIAKKIEKLTSCSLIFSMSQSKSSILYSTLIPQLLKQVLWLGWLLDLHFFNFFGINFV